MAKTQNKVQKEETLETILFNCRNSLRGRAAMTDKLPQQIFTKTQLESGVLKSVGMRMKLHL